LGDDRFRFRPAGGFGERVEHPPVLAVDLVQRDRIRHGMTVGFLLALLGGNVLHLTLASGHVVVALLIATVGAVLFGGVLGALQWLVVRERVPLLRRAWITANIGPALLAWLLVIMPAVIEAQNSHKNASTAYLLAAGQALALGPLLGLSQSLVLRKVTAAGPGGSGPTSPPG
jgi:hypothetical protein